MVPSPMSGVTVLALRFFLNDRLGEEELQTVLEQACLPRHHVLQFTDPRLRYDDAVPDAVVQTVLCAVLDSTALTLDGLMSEFGGYLLDWVSTRSGYQMFLGRVSNSFIGFARYLNALLSHMYLALGNRKPGLPEAHVTDVSADSFTLGTIMPEAPSAAAAICLAVYEGILARAAAQVFGISIQIEGHTTSHLSTGRVMRSCKVLVHQSTLEPSASIRNTILSSASEVHSDLIPGLPGLAPSVSRAHSGAHGAGSELVGLDLDSFGKLFPFHFALDMELRVLHAGEALMRLVPEMAVPGTPVQSVLTMRLPRVLWSLDCLQSILENGLSSKVVLSSGTGPDLCGGLHPVHRMRRSCDGTLVKEDMLLFVGSLSLANVEEMERCKLYLDDFPPHEQAPEHMLRAAAKHVQSMEALHVVRRSNEDLRESLAEALSTERVRLVQEDAGGESVGHTLLQLLDSMLMGTPVSPQQVVHARKALLQAGDNVWRPTAMDRLAADSEVNASLAEMLGATSLISTQDMDSPGPHRMPSQAAARCSGGIEPSSVHGQDDAQFAGAAAADCTPELMAALASTSSSGCERMPHAAQLAATHTRAQSRLPSKLPAGDCSVSEPPRSPLSSAFRRLKTLLMHKH